MTGSRMLATLSLAALIAVSACDADDGEAFFTAPEPPANGGPALDAECDGDSRPPVIRSAFPKPDLLWPPNHQMTTVAVHARAEDACGPLEIEIVSVRSNEPVNGLGDGDTAPDWEITGPLTVRLRAERSGTGAGRRYTIRVRFADGIGNERFDNIVVHVPHDR